MTIQDLKTTITALNEQDGVTYRVLSAHTTQTYWPPAESPSLFQRT